MVSQTVEDAKIMFTYFKPLSVPLEGDLYPQEQVK